MFCIKLDEAEVVHAQKFERVSLTLMNRALDSSIDPKSEKYFSVQSEREVWPIAAFQIPKESHKILSWVFSQTKIPSLIDKQERGQMLEVAGIGSFKVEWHMAADMKTVKCMYGLSMGANNPFSCIYCNQQRCKSMIGTIEQAETVMKEKQKYSWSHGLFSNTVDASPTIGHERWKPVLPIPLDRVHICTLHCLNRIIEKLVHLHFMQVWVIRNEARQKEAIIKMQKAVSLTGAHGGNVIMFKDEDLSGKCNNIPNKCSFSGPHAMKLFKLNPETITGSTPRKLYVDVVNAEQNFANRGQDKRDRLELWRLLDELRPYCQGLRLQENQSAADFKQKVEAWGRLFVKCFGEQHVTHYMVRFHNFMSVWYVCLSKCLLSVRVQISYNSS